MPEGLNLCFYLHTPCLDVVLHCTGMGEQELVVVHSMESCRHWAGVGYLQPTYLLYTHCFKRLNAFAQGHLTALDMPQAIFQDAKKPWSYVCNPAPWPQGMRQITESAKSAAIQPS